MPRRSAITGACIRRFLRNPTERAHVMRGSLSQAARQQAAVYSCHPTEVTLPPVRIPSSFGAGRATAHLRRVRFDHHGGNKTTTAKCALLARDGGNPDVQRMYDPDPFSETKTEAAPSPLSRALVL